MEEIWAHRPIMQGNMPPLPISLKAFGIHHATRGWQERNSGLSRPHCGAFWALSGEATLIISQKKHCLQEGNIVSYYPSDGHFIEVTSDQFSYLWFTFDGLAAVDILRGYSFPDEPFYSGLPPEKLLKKIYKSMLDYSIQARYRDSNFVYQLLTRARTPFNNTKNNTYSSPHNLIQKFKEYVDQNYMEPETNLNNIASELECHRTTLTRLLKENIGITPSEYITNVRIQKALIMLQNSTLTIAQISDRCGFSSPNYFCRRIKNLFGSTPFHLRNNINV